MSIRKGTGFPEARGYGLEVASRCAAVRAGRVLTADTWVVALGALAGLTYLSWPLGYLLNPNVVAVGLASDLEVPGQPFAWLFVGLDVLSGALMLGVAAALWGRTVRRWFLVCAILGYALFGISSAVSAAVPLSCGVGRAALLTCGTDPGSYGLHDAVSVVGYFALFVSIFGCLGRATVVRHPRRLRTVTVVVGGIWAASGLTFLGLTLAGLPEVACQHVLLLATSAAIVLFPCAICSERLGSPGATRSERLSSRWRARRRRSPQTVGVG